jgi:ATP-dependent Clp protease ATP-binding subunit ClpC
MRGVDPPAGDDWLILALALGAIALAYALGRRAGAPPAGAPAAKESGAPEPTPARDNAQVPDSAALYRAADRLREFFEAAAQPTDLLANGDFREGVQLLCDPAFGVNDLVAYVNGDSQVIACFAAQALRERREPDAGARLLQSVGTLGPWSMYFVLRYLHEATGPEQALVGRVLAGSVGYLPWRQPAQFLEEFVRDRAAAGEVPGFADELARVDESAREPLERFVAALDPEVRGSLLEDFQRIVQQRGDVELLHSIGMLWDPREPETDDSVDHADFEEAVESLLTEYSREPSRSVLLVGERGVGKSVIAHRVARRLQARGWQIFEASPADLVAGQVHIGEFEGQLRKLLARLGSGRILWIVPEFPSLALSGRHQYSNLSALDTILPELERGRVALLGECLPGAYERLVLSNARVATALEVRRVKPLPAEATVALARTWLADRALLPERGEELLVEAWQLAQQFLAGRSAPGNLMRLLRITVQRLAASDATAPPRLRLDDLVATLGATTGLPSVLLDEREALDLDGLRALFGRRVIGQQEAVDCLVERVAMVKAGLTDPSRPFGVFLFAGPTGTGKTEIAKTLAEFLFGSPERMIRIDMSELQGYEDVERLLGGDDPEKSQALVDRIRKQPFSVVLLDEFEKAHPRVWDLFLQLFDDGRLTDRRGNTADFRCAIVILTSNLGGVIPAGDRPGFSDGPGDRQGEFSARGVLRALSRAFRPELLNRLDRIVVFRPLDRETMRGILRRELADVFLRRGLRSREWAVEWDPSAIEFLLEEGFTPDMGARPLKRAIERHLLAPLASTIVSHRVPRGDQFLYITCRDDALAVEFVDPDAQPADAAAADAGARDGSLSLRSIALSPRGSAAEIGARSHRASRVLELAGPLRDPLAGGIPGPHRGRPAAHRIDGGAAAPAGRPRRPGAADRIAGARPLPARARRDRRAGGAAPRRLRARRGGRVRRRRGSHVSRVGEEPAHAGHRPRRAGRQRRRAGAAPARGGRLRLPLDPGGRGRRAPVRAAGDGRPRLRSQQGTRERAAPDGPGRRAPGPAAPGGARAGRSGGEKPAAGGSPLSERALTAGARRGTRLAHRAPGPGHGRRLRPARVKPEVFDFSWLRCARPSAAHVSRHRIADRSEPAATQPEPASRRRSRSSGSMRDFTVRRSSPRRRAVAS